MKKIAHLSDLHFGTVDNSIAEGLISHLNMLKPDVTVISGDLTQRARKKQFADAENFLSRLPKPQVVIPGNHDIALFDVFRRLFLPLKRYKKFISDDLNPLYEDDEIALLGINTARSSTWKNGRVSVEQIKMIENTLCKISDDKIKIISTHHPFIPPPGEPGIQLVGRSIKAVKIIEQCNIDLLLAGHLHHGYSGDIRPYYPSRNKSIISAQAGTAISRRTRKEPNAFNFIFASKENIKIEIRVWNGTDFFCSLHTTYNKVDNEWLRE
jgi:3',5'-cyclic AMP phosphodiesterase CpdA